ncbi:ACT domain-containing protein [Sulfuriroseicoccus oceanibius]|uniref:ACT domain-containing protein n=1 Tax=Sulfuriroseicoccus oceanibius TaxID=2707525 RepID=A0A6B3LBI3_9BACT|nr:ACT domain-containing protein [Sulfuriroseicoccus oceanibius]QQL45423.1 ACT domain-containing protein [Sulfuriroseicoccus oceanibius]
MQEITVFVNNQPGAVADVTATLAAADINIEEIDAEGVVESGVITLCVDQHNEGLAALKAAGFDAHSEDALIIKLEDKPGALAQIAARLKESNINLRSLRIIDHVGSQCLASIVADNQPAARKALKDVILSL